MAATAGISTVVQVCHTAGGTYVDVEDINSVSMSHSGNSIDVGVFNSGDFVKRILGIRDVSYSMSGFWNPTAGEGQALIRASWLGTGTGTLGTDLFVSFQPTPSLAAGSKGFKQKVVVGSFDISSTADGVVEFSCDLEGNGAVVADNGTPS